MNKISSLGQREQTVDMAKQGKGYVWASGAKFSDESVAAEYTSTNLKENGQFLSQAKANASQLTKINTMTTPFPGKSLSTQKYVRSHHV